MLAELLDRLDQVVSELAAADITPLSDEELLDVLRRLEVAKRRLAPVDHAVLNSADSRGLHSTLRCASLPALLSELLRIDRSEANARVRAAENFGTRSVWSGGLVGPRFPDTAAALADGAISAAQAAVVARAVDALPDAVVDEHGDFVEKTLLEHSRTRRRTGSPRTAMTWSPCWTRTGSCARRGNANGAATCRSSAAWTGRRSWSVN